MYLSIEVFMLGSLYLRLSMVSLYSIILSVMTVVDGILREVSVMMLTLAAPLYMLVSVLGWLGRHQRK